MVDIKVINASVTGAQASTTTSSVNGQIYRIRFDHDGNGTTGSVFVLESGTNTVLTHSNSFSADVNYYPRVQISDTSSNTISAGSGNIWINPVVNGPVIVGGSGLQAGSTFTATIYWV